MAPDAEEAALFLNIERPPIDYRRGCRRGPPQRNQKRVGGGRPLIASVVRLFVSKFPHCPRAHLPTLFLKHAARAQVHRNNNRFGKVQCYVHL
jgi:hypothetical protein